MAPGQRGYEPVGQPHPEERTDQRAANQFTEDLRRLGNRAHRLDNAQHRRNDPQRRQGISHSLDSVRNLPILVVMGLQFLIHQVGDFVRVFGAQRDHPQIVAKELHGVVIRHELRELGEQLALFRVLHMGFQGQIALGFGELEQGVKQG